MKTYEKSSTFIGLRFLKPDFESGHWYRQSHFSFKLEATLLGFGDESATEASRITVHYPQEFARPIEIALSNGFNCGGGKEEGIESAGMSSLKEAQVRKV